VKEEDMTDQPMTGRVALVAGASKGIGAATAEAFAAAGAAVVLAARDKDALTSVAARIQAAGGRATAVPADVADTESMQSLVEQTVARYGRLDTAFNNATDGPLPAPLADIDVAAFGHFRRPNYAARVVRPAADGWYPGRRGRHARDPWPVLVEMSGAWPGRPLPPWPPAQPGVPYAPPAGRGIPRLAGKEGSGRCPACNRTVLLRRDGLVISHKTGSLRCPGSVQEPAEPVPVASWLPLRPGLTPHGLRHGHETWLERRGVASNATSRRLA